MKVTISGMPGSGKSSIAKQLAEKLKWNYYDLGKMRRAVAEKHRITLEQLNNIGETESWTDVEADQIMEEIGKKQNNFVFVGRLAYHFIPDSVKIFLKCDLEEGAKRIMSDKDTSRQVEKYNSVEEAKQLLKERMISDMNRYEKYYKVNPYNESQFDYVIDTTHLTKEEVFQRIIDLLF